MKLTKIVILIALLVTLSTGFFILTLTPFTDFIQKVVYGDPKKVCVKNIEVKVDSDWSIEWIDFGSQHVSYYRGIVPKYRGRKQESAVSKFITLRSKSLDVSLHITVLDEVSKNLEQSCLQSPFCSLGNLDIGAVEKVATVDAGSSMQVNFIEKPIAMQVPRGFGNSVKGVNLGSCQI
jgi:hypothetical protein